jgi:hypothetical protein
MREHPGKVQAVHMSEMGAWLRCTALLLLVSAYSHIDHPEYRRHHHLCYICGRSSPTPRQLLTCFQHFRLGSPPSWTQQYMPVPLRDSPRQYNDAQTLGPCTLQTTLPLQLSCSYNMHCGRHRSCSDKHALRATPLQLPAAGDAAGACQNRSGQWVLCDGVQNRGWSARGAEPRAKKGTWCVQVCLHRNQRACSTSILL